MMPEWTRLWTSLFHMPPWFAHQAGSVHPSPRLVIILAGLLVLLVLWEDWRWGLLLWVGIGATVSALLADLLPLPWALSRLFAATLDGTLLWFGARRWPRVWRGRTWGLFPRLALLAVAALITYQLRTYTFLLHTNSVYADAMLVLVMGGLVLLIAGADVFYSTLGMLTFIHAAVFFLVTFPMPRVWIYPLTLLDIVVALIGSVALASEGGQAHRTLQEEAS